MPKLTITENLGSCLKNLRIKYNIKAIDLAKHIEKSGAYITKLEKAEIQSMDINELYKMVKFITQDDDEMASREIEQILNECSLNYTEEESKDQEWMMNFDTVLRNIPIPNLLKDFLNQKFEELSLNTEEVVNYINSNFDLYSDNNTFLYGDISSYPKNIWVFNNGKAFIIMHVQKKDIDSILSGEIDCCNYVTMESIVLTLYKKMNYSVDDAYNETAKTLNQFKFYSIREKKRLLKEKQSEEEKKEILNEFDTKNITVINSILKHLQFFSDVDLKYTNKKLENLNNNFKIDSSLAIAFLGIDLTKLKDADKDIKKNFLKAVNELINEYSTKVPEKKEVDLF